MGYDKVIEIIRDPNNAKVYNVNNVAEAFQAGSLMTAIRDYLNLGRCSTDDLVSILRYCLRCNPLQGLITFDDVLYYLFKNYTSEEKIYILEHRIMKEALDAWGEGLIPHSPKTAANPGA